MRLAWSVVLFLVMIPLRADEGLMTVTVGDRMVRLFDPRQALGAGLDGHRKGESKGMLSQGSVRRMLDAGMGPVSVRLRTELGVEAWHWNPRGRWSDPARRQGYWTSEERPDPARPILASYGYRLPRRGHTLDEANDEGYSMLVDGDPRTFWKSNPYLTRAYTGEPDDRHPQWIVLDFGKPVPINAINILWGEPYAIRFRVEYANRGRVYFGGHPWNVWHSFPRGTVRDGRGGEQFLKLGAKPVMARYLRVWMTGGSGTSANGSADPRDAMGFAIREVMAGEAGQFDFQDHVLHRPDKTQTLCYVSSTDPWHRERDLDPQTEQPGLDRIAGCGVTRGLPMMLSVPVLYDTPENGAALAAYARRAKIPVSRLELGEEPDGQRVDPRDFGALYAQTAGRIVKSDPDAVMGGPSFVTLDVNGHDDQTYRFDKRWWVRDFRGELARHGESRSFRFLSFEWYPFDDVMDPSARMEESSPMLERTLRRYLPLGLPLIVSEYNYSVFPCRQEVDLTGGLLNAEIAAQFLRSGGATAYYYGYEPNRLENTCGSWGNHLMLLRSGGGTVPVATFHALRIVTQEWMEPRGGMHGFLSAKVRGGKGLLEAFALRRPGGEKSLLLINKGNAPLRVTLQGMTPRTMTLYGREQYAWLSDGADGHPLRNLPPRTTPAPAGSLSIPPFSLAVIR